MKRREHFFAICGLLCVFLTPLQAQETKQEGIPVSVVSLQQPDTCGVSENNEGSVYKKHYIAAAGGALLVNGAIGAWDRFVVRSGWAQVTLDDALHFYEHNQEWDTDWYWTNFVLHPYQGSLSYMAARNCNLSPLESELAALGSSFIWEYFCETNAPSINDMVFTPIGGFAFGEMLYRLSLETYAKNKYLAWVINPLRLYTVPITGEHPHGPTGQIKELSCSWTLGSSYGKTTTSDDYDAFNYYTYPVYVLPRLDIVYGSLYGLDTNIPYSHFDLSVFGGIGYAAQTKIGDPDNRAYDISLLSDGIIFSRAPDLGQNKLTTVGLSFDYDFIWNPFIELSTLAPGFVIKQQIQHEHSISEWEQHVDVVVLGTSDYYDFASGALVPDGLYRDYSYNSGFKTISAYTWKPEASFKIKTMLYCYALYDFEGQRQHFAKTGWELAGIGSLNCEHNFNEKVSIGLEGLLYFKASLYSKTDTSAWNSDITYNQSSYNGNNTVIQSLFSANVYIKFNLL